MNFRAINKCWFLLILVFLFLQGCTDDKPTPPVESKEPELSELLPAYWTFQSAKRNGRDAPSLDGLYFDFSKKDSLSTNIMGSDETNRYEIAGNIIRRHGEVPMNFTVDSLTDSYLQLSMKMNGSSFEFVLGKGESKK